MATIKTRTFHRVVVYANFQTAVDAVTAEVNAFAATFADPADILDIKYVAGPAASQVFYIANVIFLEE